MSHHLTPTQQAELVHQAPNLQDIVDAFAKSQDVKPSSREVYRKNLKRFLAWVQEKGYTLAELTRAEVLQYKEELLAKGTSPLTTCSYLVTVKLFYAWAEAEKLYPNIARAVRVPKRVQSIKRSPLTTHQAAALLKYYQEQGTPRDYALISLMLRTGLRTVEVCRITQADITQKAGQRVLMIQGKGRDGKDAFVILTQKAWAPLQAYLQSKGPQLQAAPLFTSTSNNNQGSKLTTRTIRQIARQGLDAIGCSDKVFTAHSLRHTAGCSILRAGGSIEQAQLTLRHSSPVTTQIYVKHEDEQRRLQNSGEALVDSLF
jgi:integrase/recombinase XerC/integrase/recombinase XerD